MFLKTTSKNYYKAGRTAVGGAKMAEERLMTRTPFLASPASQKPRLKKGDFLLAFS